LEAYFENKSKVKKSTYLSPEWANKVSRQNQQWNTCCFSEWHLRSVEIISHVSKRTWSSEVHSQRELRFVGVGKNRKCLKTLISLAAKCLWMEIS